jgi:hypothetical protein
MRRYVSYGIAPTIGDVVAHHHDGRHAAHLASHGVVVLVDDLAKRVVADAARTPRRRAGLAPQRAAASRRVVMSRFSAK